MRGTMMASKFRFLAAQWFEFLTALCCDWDGETLDKLWRLQKRERAFQQESEFNRI